MDKLRIIGEIHNEDHEDFLTLLEYVSGIKPTEKVSIECPWSIENLLMEKCPSTMGSKATRRIVQILTQNRIEIKPVEDLELYKKHKECLNVYGGLDHHMKGVFHELCCLRTVALYELALANNSDILITGALHAYELDLLKHDSVNLVMISNPTEEQKELSKKTIDRYLAGEFNRESVLRLNISPMLRY